MDAFWRDQNLDVLGMLRQAPISLHRQSISWARGLKGPKGA